MSATISVKDANFTIFGSGHDYTRIDSGDGRKRFFSHPSLPKGAKLCANHYLFFVPDEDGNRIDAVRYDISHCTFSPAIGSILNTVGEQTIQVVYHREYIHDEETILVERIMETTVEVVDHGAIVTSDYTHDVYADGYCYVRPSTANHADPNYYTNENGRQFSKISCIPFRAYSLKRLCEYSHCEDISELEFADLTYVQSMQNTFYECDIEDLSPLSQWDTSNVTNMSLMFADCRKITDLSPLSKWDVSKVKDMSRMFAMSYGSDTPYYGVNYIKSLHGLEKWDVSNVTNFTTMFYDLYWLEDISAVKNWDISSGTDFSYMFAHCNADDLDEITWDLSHITNASKFASMFDKGFIFHSSALNKDILKGSLIHYSGGVDDEGNIYTDGEIGTLTSISHDADNASNWTVTVSGANAFTAYDASNSGWINIPSWN